MVQITINRPERRNAFRPQTVKELKRAFDLARDDTRVGVIIFTGQVGSRSHLSCLACLLVFLQPNLGRVLQGTEAFCSGGDQAVRGKHGYVGDDNIGRLDILDVQVLMLASYSGQVSNF